MHSEDTARSHATGKKHVMRKLAMEERNEKLRSQGLAPETKSIIQVILFCIIYAINLTLHILIPSKILIHGKRFENSIFQIPNPSSLQKKVPIRLVEKLRESREAVVGLENIIEIIACSDPEVEPYYECLLCERSNMEANGMFTHLVGKKHRQRFIEKKFPNDPR